MADSTRASDAERTRTVEVLQQALHDGRLDTDEFNNRMEQALHSKTRGELAELVADLPAAATPAVVPVPAPVTPTDVASQGKSLKAAWASWAGVSLMTFVIWGITSIGAGQVQYPWFLWVAGPWGAAMLMATLVNKARDD